MSRRGFVGALVRASKLQSCGRCGHTWFPRGHWRSSKCPSCGTLVATASSGSGSRSAADFGTGCLALLGIPLGIVLLCVVGAQTGTTGVVVVLVAAIAVPVGVSASKKRSARLRTEAAQRQLALEAEESRRLLSAQTEEAERHGKLRPRRLSASSKHKKRNGSDVLPSTWRT
jgi:hypothetical protein